MKKTEGEGDAAVQTRRKVKNSPAKKENDVGLNTLDTNNKMREGRSIETESKKERELGEKAILERAPLRR